MSNKAKPRRKRERYLVIYERQSRDGVTLNFYFFSSQKKAEEKAGEGGKYWYTNRVTIIEPRKEFSLKSHGILYPESFLVEKDEGKKEE